MLAEKLLRMSYRNKRNIKSIVSFLCSDSGSHDYTISRTEAKRMGLQIESPTQETYTELKNWFIDTSAELELSKPYNPLQILGNNNNSHYLFKRSQYAKALELLCKNEKILSETLAGDTLKLFNKLMDASDEIIACTGTENFKMGFSLGVQLMADCFKYDSTTIFKDI